MGNITGSFFCCDCLGEIIRGWLYQGENLHKGLIGPDGSMISLEGMIIGCRVNNVYPDGGMEVSFDHNISGHQTTSTRYIIVNNRDNKALSCFQTFVTLKILEDRRYVLVTEIANSNTEGKTLAGNEAFTGEEKEANVVLHDSLKGENCDKNPLVDPEVVTSEISELKCADINQAYNDDKSDLEIVSPLRLDEDVIEGSSVMIENFRIYDDHGITS